MADADGVGAAKTEGQFFARFLGDEVFYFVVGQFQLHEVLIFNVGISISVPGLSVVVWLVAQDSEGAV